MPEAQAAAYGRYFKSTATNKERFHKDLKPKLEGFIRSVGLEIGEKTRECHDNESLEIGARSHTAPQAKVADEEPGAEDSPSYSELERQLAVACKSHWDTVFERNVAIGQRDQALLEHANLSQQYKSLEQQFANLLQISQGMQNYIGASFNSGELPTAAPFSDNMNLPYPEFENGNSYGLSNGDDRFDPGSNDVVPNQTNSVATTHISDNFHDAPRNNFQMPLHAGQSSEMYENMGFQNIPPHREIINEVAVASDSTRGPVTVVDFSTIRERPTSVRMVEEEDEDEDVDEVEVPIMLSKSDRRTLKAAGAKAKGVAARKGKLTG